MGNSGSMPARQKTVNKERAAKVSAQTELQEANKRVGLLQNALRSSVLATKPNQVGGKKKRTKSKKKTKRNKQKTKRRKNRTKKR